MCTQCFNSVVIGLFYFVLLFIQMHNLVVCVDQGPNYKNILWFLTKYLKLDLKSIVSSQLTGTIPYHVSYDYRKLITKSDLSTS